MYGVKCFQHPLNLPNVLENICLVWFGLVWFYGKSTIVGYSMQNLFFIHKIILFQTIQFRIITQFQCQKRFYFKKLSLAYKKGSISNNLVKHSLVLFEPTIGPYLMLPFRTTVNLGAMAMNRYSVYHKDATSLEPNYSIV